MENPMDKKKWMWNSNQMKIPNKMQCNSKRQIYGAKMNKRINGGKKACLLNLNFKLIWI